MDRDCVFRTTIARMTNHLANSQSELDKANARIAQLAEALKTISTFPRYGMPADIAKSALAGSSDAWILEHDKAVELRVLEDVSETILHLPAMSTLCDCVEALESMAEARK